MANFHNTPDGPAPCRARHGRCPFGKDGEDHYDNQADAQKAYDSSMASKYGTTKSHSRLTSPSHSGSPRRGSMTPALGKHLRPAAAGARAKAAPFTRPPKSSSSTSPVGKFAKRQAKQSVKSLKSNYKILLMTKYWVPDPSSDAWKR